ncbi:phosphoribosylformylglycinamidine cyclo-ligase [Patescibacteria group bacterium]|nr:MAG: phosphoribosylformylglycinamidine cyclo-ligase [Patescibacteria group bacterium]
MSNISYSDSGVNYQALDPVKKLAQIAARSTARHLSSSGFTESEDTRGESAYVWQQGDLLMASVIEGLGTKNLVADAMRKITGKTYYDIVSHDTVATIINDLVSVGAKPLALFAYWAVGKSEWLADAERTKDLADGWKSACDLAQVSWGGGETPAYAGIINPETIDLAGSAVGIIKDKNNLLTDKKIQAGDRIIFLKSNGINANGLSLARAIANTPSSPPPYKGGGNRLPPLYKGRVGEGYGAKLPSGVMYGEALLTKTNIYAKLVQDLQAAEVDIHYITNITGHGLRKVMRGRPNFTYVIEKIFEPLELFIFMQGQAGLSDFEMYQTFNMGQDYAIYLSAADVARALEVIKQNNFTGIEAGFVEAGEKRVIIKPKNLEYKGETLDLR